LELQCRILKIKKYQRNSYSSVFKKKMKKINKNKSTFNRELSKNSLKKRGGFLLFKILGLVLIFGLAFQIFLVKADDENEIEKDLEELSEEKEELEKEAQKTETELQQVNQQISQTQSVIWQTTQSIEELEDEIDSKKDAIKKKEKNIKFKRQILAEYLRLFRKNNLEIGLAIYNVKQDLGKFLRERESYEDFQAKIEESLNTIKKEKEAIEEVKEEVEEKKEEKEEVLETHQEQKQNLAYQEQQKQAILSNTKATIAEVNQKMSELKADLNRILGKSYDTGEIKDAIKFANKVTGVSKGFIFGVLSMESGGNPLAGKCTLKDADMTKTREDYFEKICDELDFSSSKCKKMPVSCASKSYPGSGGAMGAAQFMSDTWWGKKDDIAKVTGHNPPNPWNLLDGVVAMALYLEQHGATESGKVRITNPCDGEKVKVEWEIYASMRYLGWTCWAYTNYAPGIQNLKDGYDDL
jgi:peptidoglycan hydrolase CwlO-like protein